MHLSGQDDFGQQGTLMLVGDPKQAIYRWRGGKAEQFIDLAKEDKKHNPFSNKDKETLRLGTNYRSYSEVIQFNNAFFKQLAAKFLKIQIIKICTKTFRIKKSILKTAVM
jgi:ATP-dependent exoDNAse (exonuclease V) beta subunit